MRKLGAVKICFKVSPPVGTPKQIAADAKQVLLPSPRNPPATTLSLMQQTNCTKILYFQEIMPVVRILCVSRQDLMCIEVPSFQEMLKSRPKLYPFAKSFADAQDDPIVVLHSSESTGGFV